MQITINTDQPLSTTDRQLLATLIGASPADTYAAELEKGDDTSGKTFAQAAADETAKPKRRRRTNAQIAADEAAAAAKAEDDAVLTRVAADEAAAAAASETEDPTLEVVQPDETNGLDAPVVEDEPTGATVEELVEVATELATKNRQKLVEILESFGIRRASQTPDNQRDAVVAAIKEALSA